MLKQHGVFEIDIINDPQIWKEYVYKLSKDMKEYCKIEKVPYMLDTINDKLYECKIDPLQKMKKCKKEEPESIPTWMPPPSTD